jgi:hypothetical protein
LSFPYLILAVGPENVLGVLQNLTEISIKFFTAIIGN